MFYHGDILAALKARWRLEVAIFLFVLMLVIAWTIATPRKYVATASLLYDERKDPVQDGSVQQDTVAALLATQVDVLMSKATATDVARSLGLGNTPEAVEQWRAATGGNGDINAWLGTRLLSGLQVTPGKSSRVLAIQYSAADPQYAAALANGFAASYLSTRLELTTDPAKTYSRWFSERTREVRTALEQAQARLTAFQRKTGIVDVGANNADSNRLSELSSALTSAEATEADANSRAGSSASQSPDVLNSGVVQGLRSQIANKTAEVSQLAADLGPNHPTRQAAEAQLAELKARLNVEIGTATRSVRVASGSASSKEADLRGRLEGQRARMLQMATDRAQLDVLQRDVESARASYDAVTQKLSSMRLQSEAPATNVHQLDQAVPPLLPATPNVPLRMLLGIVLGGLIATGVAIALELWRPRVRTTGGVVALGGLPVLGSIDFKRSSAGTLLLAGPTR